MTTIVGTSGSDEADAVKGTMVGFDPALVGALTDATGDFIDTYGGADSVIAGVGHDTIFGGAGRDTLFGGFGSDRIYGNTQADPDGSTDPDAIFGGADMDFLYGSAGNDTVFGGTEGDFVYGGGGNDSLVGEQGSDSLYGGEGNDTITGNEGSNYIEGGGGDDLLGYVSGNYPDAETIYGGPGNDTINGRHMVFGGEGEDLITLVIFGEAHGNEGHDTIVGSGIGDSLWGDDGNDSLSGGTGDDVLIGGEGDDSLFGGDGADSLTADAGRDFLYGGGRDDIFFDGQDLEAGDIVDGGTGLDLLIVQSAFMNLVGVDLRWIEGLLMTPVAGAPLHVLRMSAAQLNGPLLGLNLEGQGAEFFSYDLRVVMGNQTSFAVSNVKLSMWADDDGVRVDGDGDAETITGGTTHGAELLGHGGDDWLRAGTVGDSLYGGDGDDRLVGGDGVDLLRGGAGADRLSGGGGIDDLSGGEGDDLYTVDAQGEAIEAAGAGIDSVVSGVSYELGENVEVLTLTGSAVAGTGNGLRNRIVGNGEENTLAGRDGNDSLDGAGAADALYGGGGSDVLVGGTGDDRLFGGVGGDRLTGGEGRDRLDGGAGADDFVFTLAPGGGDVDRIVGFGSGADQVLLKSGAFGGLATGALGAAAFRSGPAAADGSDRIIYNAATGDLFFDADGVGGTAQVRFATLGAGTVLTAADILIV
jgi:Ca2+-binding RTX toxin-like protein